MNILLYDFLNSYIQYDLIYYLKKFGNKCNNVPYRTEVDKYYDEAFTRKMEADLDAGSYDLVLTTNFWPVVSSVCNRRGIKYVSWFFDSPPNLPTPECMEYSCNRIFFFSRADYEDYKMLGLDNVYYLPLAVNMERLDSLQTDYCRFESEISFVGKLYQSMLPAFMSHMDDYQKGYIDAVTRAQMQIYGAYMIDDLITEAFAESVRKRYKSLSESAIQISRKELAWAVISYITNVERMTLLRILSRRHLVKLYTYELSDEEKNMIPNVEFCGPVSYLEEMPQVFRASKINLCPVIKANKSGIPLRALDVMGAGGFLLSSYQPELYEYFVDGEECVMYSSLEDAMQKADFYLANDDLRRVIAEAGKAKIRRDFRYEDRIKVLLETD
jgi:spore maturation protein CgeB